MKSFVQNLVAFLLFLSLSASAQVGDPAPNFTVTGTDGNTYTLYDLLNSGKTVVLDFYYTTCGPCQYYSPQVNLAYAKYGCNDAEVFFISIDYDDTNAEVMAYDAQFGIQYPSVSGTQGGGNGVINQYGISGFPTFYVIDSSKTIVQQIDPPTLQVFDFRFQQLGLQPAPCSSKTTEAVGEEALEIYPNPLGADQILQVRLPEGDMREGSYEVFDCCGRLLLDGSIEAGGDGYANLNTGNLPEGIFILALRNKQNGKIWTGRFMN